MMAILHDKIQIAKAVNVTVISLEEAPQGYKDFDKGAAKKFVHRSARHAERRIVSRSARREKSDRLSLPRADLFDAFADSLFHPAIGRDNTSAGPQAIRGRHSISVIASSKLCACW